MTISCSIKGPLKRTRLIDYKRRNKYVQKCLFNQVHF